jgi:hypothetical protein
LAAGKDEKASLSRQNPDMIDSVFLSIRQIPSQSELEIPFDRQVYFKITPTIPALKGRNTIA